MGWWIFGKSKDSVDSAYEIDTPPGLSPVVPPPVPPKNYKSSSFPSAEFTGFSPPPPIKESNETYKSSFYPKNSTSEDYENKDYSKYVSSLHESDGLKDNFYSKNYDNSSSLQGFSNTSPRIRACMESVKLGIKMGAAVGGIFGTLTGIYASFVHRNFLLLPLSMVGGAVSFGFFLGCGMVVRCEDKKTA